MCYYILQKKNVEALATPDDCELAETIAKADTQVQAMLRERNITRLDLVACDPWSGEIRGLSHVNALSIGSSSPACKNCTCSKRPHPDYCVRQSMALQDSLTDQSSMCWSRKFTTC